jgi:hypothetical protein
MQILRVRPTPVVASPALGRARTHSGRGGGWARRAHLVSARAGLLSGKYRRGQPAPAGSRLDIQQDDFRAFDNEKNWNLLDVVGRIAEQHETTHSAVSLAWLLAQPQTSSIIVGARTEAQLEDNLRALSVKLTGEDLKALDEASRPDWDYPWDVIRDAEAGDAQLLAR